MATNLHKNIIKSVIFLINYLEMLLFVRCMLICRLLSSIKKTSPPIGEEVLLLICYKEFISLLLSQN